MHKQFDDILTKKIADTFEQYEEPYNPDNWLLLQKKLQKRQSKKIILWNMIAKAAIFIMPLYFILQPFSNHWLSRNERNNLFCFSKNDSLNILLAKPVLIASILNPVREKDFSDSNANNEVLSIDTIFDKTTYFNSFSINPDSDRIVLDKDSILLTNQKHFAKNNSSQIKKVEPLQNKIPEEIKKNNTVKFSVSVSTFNNYGASDISSSMNYSAGLQGEIPVTKNISFNSGVQFSRQRFSLNSASNQNPFLSEAASPDVTQKVSSTANTKQAEIFALDIPFNIQFSIFTGKTSSFYICTGVSSLVYLHEKFTSQYTALETNMVYNANANSYSLVKSIISNQSQENVGAFQKYDLAKLINVSFGYKISISKGFLITEPYIKIPIGKITSDNLLMGFGGISLKFGF